MKRLVSFFVALVLCFSLFGCGCSSELNNIYITSDVNCHITAPCSNSENTYSIEFNVPFYILYSGDDIYSELLTINNTFHIGENAILNGKNVELLKGGIVSVSQSNLTDYTNDDYYETLACSYGVFYLGLTEENAYNEDLINNVTDLIKCYEKNTYILTINIGYYGAITDDITVDTLSIPELNLNYKFNSFYVDTIDVPENITFDDGTNIIDYTSAQGSLSCTKIGELGYMFIDGNTLSNINSISVESANDECNVITEENKFDFQCLEETCGSLYIEQNLHNFNKGDVLSLEFDFVINQERAKPLDEDIMIISLITKTIDMDGNEYWKFVYVPYVCSGEYLMFDILDQNNISI